jgi:hypothetical protein
MRPGRRAYLEVLWGLAKKGQEGGYLIPGFWPMKFTCLDRELTLVKKAGEWKIATVPARP